MLTEADWWAASETERRKVAQEKFGPGVSPHEAAFRLGLQPLPVQPPAAVPIVPTRRPWRMAR